MSEDFPSFPGGSYSDLPDAPLEHHVSAATAVGCLGIACVLVMVVIFALPLDSLGLPPWLQLAAPLAAFGLVMLGLWVMLNLPPGRPMHSTDPLHPLTQSGVHPLMERPARSGNRAVLALAWGLILGGVAGYGVAASGQFGDGGSTGALIGAASGLLLLIEGALVAFQILPIPALRWVRVPIQSHRLRQGGPLALTGLTFLAWGLWVGASLGYFWGYFGLPVLIVAGILITPLTRQAPHAPTRRTPTRIPPIERNEH